MKKNSKTQRALEILKADPTRTAASIGRELALSEGVISRARTAEHRRLNPNSPVPSGAKRGRSRLILKIIESDPGRSATSIAREVGVHEVTVYAVIRDYKKTKHLRCPTCNHILPYLANIVKDD
jgi:DNA-binding Lrp family transcriptional regulator